MLVDIFELPERSSQGEFHKILTNLIPIHFNQGESQYAYQIDHLHNWQITLMIEYFLKHEAVKTVTFCSKSNGKLYAIGTSFRQSKLWFMDSQIKKDQSFRSIDDFNFLTVSRY